MMETTYGDYHHYVHHHPHLITTDDDSSFTNMNHNGFSRGSSTSFAYPPPQQPPDYHRYFVDRGEFAAAATRFSLPTSSSLVDNNNNSLDAAGIGFAGNPQAPPPSNSNNNFVIPEDISVYNNQWNWSQPDQPTILAPAPVYPHQAVKNSATINSLSSAVAVCSHSQPQQLPTPAAMAVLLNPNLQTDFEIPQGSSSEAESVVQTVTRPAVMMRPPVEPVVVAVQSVPDSPSREKKHACTMCHKR